MHIRFTYTLKATPSRVKMRQLFRSGRLFTGSLDDRPAKTCLVVNDGLVEYTGFEEDSFVQTAISQGCDVQDVRGQTIAPGFIDGYEGLVCL